MKQLLVKLKDFVTRSLKSSVVAFCFGVYFVIFVFLFLSFFQRDRDEISMTLPPIVMNYSPKVIEINSSVIRVNTANGFCSGVMISNVYVLTAAHCVDYLGQRVFISDADETQVFSAEVVGITDKQDYALILLGISMHVQPSKVDFTGKYLSGLETKVELCGYPGGQRALLCNSGIINGNFRFQRTGIGSLYTGMSGGPVFVVAEDGSKVVVGVNSAVNRSGIIIGPIIGLDANYHLSKEWIK